MKIKIYVEGGGDSDGTKSKCRKGFNKFFEKASFKGCMPKIIASGSRQQAYNDFCTALKNLKSNEFPVLLVDSEDLVSTTSKWGHLKARDNWQQPDNAVEDHVYLMIVCMEAWFMADKQALKKYYGQNFNQNSLPSNPKIEQIQKQDLFSGLEQATRNTQKGKYNKGEHSFEILAKIDPQQVVNSSQSVKNMVAQLKQVACK